MKKRIAAAIGVIALGLGIMAVSSSLPQQLEQKAQAQNGPVLWTDCGHGFPVAFQTNGSFNSSGIGAFCLSTSNGPGTNLYAYSSASGTTPGLVAVTAVPYVPGGPRPVFTHCGQDVQPNVLVAFQNGTSYVSRPEGFGCVSTANQLWVAATAPGTTFTFVQANAIRTVP